MSLRLISSGVAVGLLFAAACGSSSRDDLGAAKPDAAGGGVVPLGDAAFVGQTDAGRLCDPNGLDQEGCNCPSSGETRACYTAAPETRGKGSCKDGVQTCERRGEFFVWGACSGATTPMPEPCGQKLDANCNGKSGCDDPSCATSPACDTPCTDGATRPCYEGKAGTSNVGACKDGQQTCIEGHWTKSCTGQVLPGSEPGHCNDQIDNDCNGTKDCQDFACLLDFHCLTGCTAGTTRPCYDGPVGTEGVAGCHGGTQTCKPDGSGFGSCTGQVLPSSEAGQCQDGIDNDCNGVADCADPACSMQTVCCVPAPSPVDGTIWANSPTTLYRVDPSTFAVTTVGKFSTTESITDLALTPNGVLYAVSFTKIYTVNQANAVVTPIINLSGTGNDGMTFLPSGELIAGDSNGDVTRINPATGSATKIGNYGNGLKTAGDLVAVADGTMYATSAASPGGADATSNNVLIQVNPQTGAAVPIGPTGFANVWGIAFSNKHVIGFNTAGKIIQIDVATGAGTVVASKNIEFWGATQSPLVVKNACP